jgi:hypothetical protein
MKDFKLTREQMNEAMNSKTGTIFKTETYNYTFKGWEFPALVFEILPIDIKQSKFEYKFIPVNLKESEK